MQKTDPRWSTAGFRNLAVGRFGLRALAQGMARELQPRGIHVAQVVAHGRIRPPDAADPEDALPDPDAIAEACYPRHRQTRSAWTLEADLRPWAEKFWPPAPEPVRRDRRPRPGYRPCGGLL